MVNPLIADELERLTALNDKKVAFPSSWCNKFKNEKYNIYGTDYSSNRNLHLFDYHFS